MSGSAFQNSSLGASPVRIVGNGATPLGYQQITSLSAAEKLTVPTGANMAVVIATGQAVAWRDDGTAPTATIGMPLPVNTPLIVCGLALAAIQFIQASATATLDISYYG